MAKKQDDTLPENGESKPKKKGLFGLFRRKPKSQNDQVENVDGATVPAEKASDQKKPTRKKAVSSKKPAAKEKPATSSEKAPPKKRGRPKTQPVEVEIVDTAITKDDSSKKKKASNGGAKSAADANGKDKIPQKGKKKSVKGSVADAGKEPAKKRGRAKKNVEVDNIAASETAEDANNGSKKKKGLFSFLKRKKKVDAEGEHAGGAVAAKGKSADISVPPVGGEVLQMDLNPTVEDDEPKKKLGFFTRKVVLIIVALCGVSGATGAAAIVFAGPLLGNDPLKGMACKVAHQASFVLMKEKRVTAFLRSDLLPPRQRIEMLMRYTKFLESKYTEANLITVSMVDTHGPMSRINFRGDNIGAQIVYAPEPLLSMATNEKWEVRYVNVTEIYGGRFMGDRFTLSEDEITEFNNAELLASDCYLEKTDEELAAEELAAEKAVAEAEALAAALAEAADAEYEEEDAHADVDEHAEASEPGFIDNMLGMVGLGGDHSEEEPFGEMDELTYDMARGEGGQQIYPGDKGPNADVMQEKPGFFDDVLSVVGLGSNDEDMHKIPGVLGTRVKYN